MTAGRIERLESASSPNPAATVLTFANVTLRRGTNVLIEGFSATVYQGARMGLVGANGTGKSSLFKLINGELETDVGSVELAADVRLAHLAQEVPETRDTALDFVLQGDAGYTSLAAQLETAETEEAYMEVADLHEQMAAIDGYSARARAEQLLVGLGFAESDFAEPVAHFSGGWRIRLNLAQCLMAPSDLLLLDEPTNHLDIDAILWLSNYLRHYQGTLVMVSHDRDFLDETVSEIAHIERQRVKLYKGNYSQFERLRAEQLALQQANFEKQQTKIKHMQDFVRRFRAKASKARQAQSRIKALERMELIAPAHIDSPFEFQIPEAGKTSDPLLQLQDADLGYDHPVLHRLRMNVHPGDRIGLLGANGTGKSTLLKSLAGELTPLTGSYLTGQNLAIGYFSQHQVDDLDLQTDALTTIARLSSDASEQQIRDFLGGFDFHGDKVKAKVSTFSGGEKARLTLATITWQKPNLLLLDEPTNHLDIDMCQALTVALQSFGGAMVVISHDRHLLKNTVDEFLLVADGAVAPYDGDLDSYRDRVLGRSEAVAHEDRVPKQASKPVVRSAPDKRARKSRSKADRKRRAQLKTRVATIDKRLARMGEKLSEVESRLHDPGLYAQGGEDVQPLLREQASLKEAIEELEAEWLEASEALEGLESE